MYKAKKMTTIIKKGFLNSLELSSNCFISKANPSTAKAASKANHIQLINTKCQISNSNYRCNGRVRLGCKFAIISISKHYQIFLKIYKCY